MERITAHLLNMTAPSIEYDSTIYYIIYWAKGGPGPDINNLDPITE